MCKLFGYNRRFDYFCYFFHKLNLVIFPTKVAGDINSLNLLVINEIVPLD